MDETSILTQVHKEQCQPVNSNGNHVPEERKEPQQHIAAPPATITNKKQRRQRGFLSSIFCCFGAQTSNNTKASFQQRSNSSANTGQHAQSRPQDTSGIPQNSATTAASVIHQATPTHHPNNNQQQGALTKCYTDDDDNEDTTHNIHQGDDLVNEQDSPESFYLLPALRHQDLDKKCAVIDLDETLVHSSFKPVDNPDFIVPVEIDGIVHQVYVLKRPHVDEFLRRMGEIYECILFTASLAKYADPVSDLLDKTNCFRTRLFRESCVYYKGNYVKDLSKLGRDLHNVIIIDNSPASYIFHPENAVPVMSWFDDRNDTELKEMIPFLENLSAADTCTNSLQNNYNKYRDSMAMARNQQQHTYNGQ